MKLLIATGLAVLAFPASASATCHSAADPACHSFRSSAQHKVTQKQRAAEAKHRAAEQAAALKSCRALYPTASADLRPFRINGQWACAASHLVTQPPAAEEE